MKLYILLKFLSSWIIKIKEWKNHPLANRWHTTMQLLTLAIMLCHLKTYFWIHLLVSNYRDAAFSPCQDKEKYIIAYRKGMLEIKRSSKKGTDYIPLVLGFKLQQTIYMYCGMHASYQVPSTKGYSKLLPALASSWCISIIKLYCKTIQLNIFLECLHFRNVSNFSSLVTDEHHISSFQCPPTSHRISL